MPKASFGLMVFLFFFIFLFCLLIHYYWPVIHQSCPPVPSHSTPINSNTIHCHLFHLNSPNSAFWHHLGFCSCHSPLSTPPHSTPINSTTTSSVSTAQMVPFGIVWAFFLSLTTVHPHHFCSLIQPPHTLTQPPSTPQPPLQSQQPKRCQKASFGLTVFFFLFFFLVH